MANWFVVLPPLITLCTAILTRKIPLSLGIGSATAALIATNGSTKLSIQLIATRVFEYINDIDTFYSFSFLFMIGILVILINSTGGAAAFAHKITRHLTNAASVEFSSILLSCSLFIDDYLNSLTVGYIIRPLTQTFAIPRAKLAFLIHSFAGPLVVLIPLSSWSAYIIKQLDQSGIALHNGSTTVLHADPFAVFLQTVPFIFYSFLLLASVLFIVHNRISFGPMHKHEHTAQTTGNLWNGKTPLEQAIDTTNTTNQSLFDLLVPMGTLVASVIVGIPFFGDYYLFGGTRSLIDSFNNSNTFLALFTAGIITVCISLLFAVYRKKIQLTDITSLITAGISIMLPAVMMVLMAGTLGSLLKNDLHTGIYLAELLIGSVPIAFLPCMFFIASAIIAITTGSAWGTIALMLPIAIPMLLSFLSLNPPLSPHDIPILFPVLGAILAGSASGDHISPISETTIMTSTSAGAYPFDHTQTQFPYALPVLCSSALSFLIAGNLTHYPILINASLSLSVGLIVCLGSLSLLNRWYK